MPIAVLCPGCSVRLNAPDTAAGKNVKCPKCATLMTIPTPAPPENDFEVVDEPPKKKPAAPPSRSGPGSARQQPPAPSRKPVKTDVMLDDDDEDDDRPRRRRYDDEDDDEDDDRPRKKKGKKKAKSGGMSPGVMIAIGVGAVLLLAGGGIGIFYATRDKPKDTATNTTGGGGANTGSRLTPPSGWVVFTPPTGGFKLYVPATPSFMPTAPTPPVKTISAVMYRGEDETNLVGVQIQVIYFPPGMDETAKRQELDKRVGVEEIRSKLENAITVVSESKNSTLAGVTAHELVVELDMQAIMQGMPKDLKQTKTGRPIPNKMTIVSRSIVSGDRGYVVMLISAGRHAEEKAVFDNFELIPETPGAGGGDGPSRPPTRGNPVRK